MLLGDNQFAIDTNFNFDKLNSHYHQSVPVSFNTITPAYLVGQILDARSSLFLGAKYMAEMVTDPATAAIARLKCVELMRKRDHEVREIDLFQELYLPEARTLREAINSGERTFEEFLKLSEASHKFKSWLGTHNPDRTLLGEYYSAATKESWVDALPTRGARWLICTGLSAMAEHFYPAGGAIVVGAQAVSAADALFIDRLLKGWRPNHFIDDVLGPFVAKEGIDSTSAT